MTSNKPRTFAFIDGQNLNRGIRSQGWILDYRKFRQLLARRYGVSEAFYFIGHVEGEETLYNTLQATGFKLVFKPTLEKPDETIKGNVDAELVLHAMVEYPNYDQAVIVTGDGDFYCLLEYLESQGKLGKILVPNRQFSSLLRQFTSFMTRLDKLQKNLEYKKRSTKKPVDNNDNANAAQS